MQDRHTTKSMVSLTSKAKFFAMSWLDSDNLTKRVSIIQDGIVTPINQDTKPKKNELLLKPQLSKAYMLMSTTRAQKTTDVPVTNRERKGG